MKHIEKAAIDYGQKVMACTVPGAYQSEKDAFIAGAEWQRQKCASFVREMGAVLRGLNPDLAHKLHFLADLVASVGNAEIEEPANPAQPPKEAAPG